MAETQVVHVRVNDAHTDKPTPVRIRFSTPEGRYVSPLGRLTELPWPGDAAGHLVRGDRIYAYIDGSCEIRLPAGPIEIEISKGPEYVPIRQTLERGPGQVALRFDIERRFDWQAEGWYAGDTGVHCLSPHAAALEGAAEGLHVVNVLAVDWRLERNLISNLLEFSGQEPALMKHGCLVAVNTQTRGPRGRVSLLNCHRVVHPLRLEQEGFETYRLLDCCRQCHRKGGLTIWPGFRKGAPEQFYPDYLSEMDAIEWTARSSFPEDMGFYYELLARGHRLSLVGGSGKDSCERGAGEVRTYARLDQGVELSYGAWIEAIRKGRCVATRGPLLRLTANGKGPGDTLNAEETASPVSVEAIVDGLFQGRLEVIHNGRALGQAASDANETACVQLRADLQAGWLAARCWDAGLCAHLCAHTSPIYIQHPSAATSGLIAT